MHRPERGDAPANHQKLAEADSNQLIRLRQFSVSKLLRSDIPTKQQRITTLAPIDVRKPSRLRGICECHQSTPCLTRIAPVPHSVRSCKSRFIASDRQNANQCVANQCVANPLLAARRQFAGRAAQLRSDSSSIMFILYKPERNTIAIRVL